MVSVEWSGAYPCLCFGKWSLFVDDIDVSDKIPDDIRCSDMNTYGTYQEWHFEEWSEVFEDYDDGLFCEEWIEKNNYWLNNISSDHELKIQIYDAFQSKDWRHGSCGGCI
jgi:hypothetical protein